MSQTHALPAPPPRHPYADFLQKVEKPARYTGGEVGSKRKDWAGVEATVCLAFPDVYDIGMSHLGYKILYSILNNDPRTLAERAYAPWPDMEAELRARKLPLVSHESARPLSDFDVVGLSLQFELTYTNCLTILDLGGIPLRQSARDERDPLVIGGGPNATHPEPVSAFFDAFLIGDGEAALTDLALVWARLKKAGAGRRDRLVALSKLPGVYVPSLYEVAEDPDSGLQVVTRPLAPGVPARVVRAFVPDLSAFPFPTESPVGGPEAIFDRLSIEIARGCTEGCRFCQAGMIYRPVRERDPEEIVNTVVAAVQKAGYDEVSLTSLSTADASCISPLIKKVVERLTPERVSLGVSSLRAYGLDDELLDELRAVRANGLTFAPEAGTQRMRDVVNKNVTEEQLLETADRVFRKGWDKMKLYFMIGLPTEQDEDVRGIVETGKRTLAHGVKAQKGSPRAQKGSLRKLSVTVSVSTHVPKPHTPFQWCAMDTLEEVQRKQRILRDEARGSRVDLKVHDGGESVLEGVFARGDRKLGDVIEEAWRGGARFDSWEEHVRLPVWRAAFEKFGIDPDRYLGTIPVSARLPWDHIDVGLEDGFLLREYRKALRSRLSPPCGKAVGMFIHHTNVADAEADQRRLVCYDCGVACDMSLMRQERIGFLDKMGARDPGSLARRLPVLRDAPAEPPPLDAAGPDAPEPDEPSAESAPLAGPGAPSKPSAPAPAPAPAFRYRLSFEKLGSVAFLGHLDLIRALPRVLRRIDVPMAYTQGFHPKPDMIFGPALSLGTPSLEEYIDVKLRSEPEPAWLLERMNGAVPEGLRFTGVARLSDRDPVLTKVITGATYALVFARSALPFGEDALRERVAAALAATSLEVRREIERVVKVVDVRQYLEKAAVGTAAAAEAAWRAGLIGDLVVVEIETRIAGSGSVKALEVAEVLVGADVPCRPIRMRMLTAHGLSPLGMIGVAGLKPLPTARAPREAPQAAATEP